MKKKKKKKKRGFRTKGKPEETQEVNAGEVVALLFTSTFPLLAHKKQSTLGVTGTEVSRPRPPASHTFSTSRSLLKSTRIRCTPSQGALGRLWFPAEGVFTQFKVLPPGGLAIRGFSGSGTEEYQVKDQT